MNNFVFSNYFPAELTKWSVQKVLLDLIRESSEIIIASGYISNDAVVELLNIVENNYEKVDELTLFVGMHYLEGFTRQQYYSLLKLNNFLQKNNKGAIYISQSVKFHGKLYSFLTNEGKQKGLIGSANLSSFIQSLERTYETMLLFDSNQEAKELKQRTLEVIEKLGTKIDDIPELSEEDFRKVELDLSDYVGVSKVNKSELDELINQESTYEFKIPLKTEPKSNLNVFFGKGRVNQRGFVLPRPWYEVEIIVGNEITKLDGYPKDKMFRVITSDGWEFECKTQGDYAKNFRSTKSLSILGKWIKGKLENAGCLETGQMVTDEVLECYGRNTMTLCSTNKADLWILEFE